MMRLAALVLVAVVAGIPLEILAAAPVTWLAGAALSVGGVGALALSMSFVTAGAALALIAYTLALTAGRPAADPIVSVVFGGTLVLLLALVHFAGRVDGALIGRGVIAGQLRRWLGIVALGVVAAGGLAAGGAVLGPILVGATLPIVVVAAALGSLLTVAGVIALVTAPSGTAAAAPKADER
jgi:hypothetical protein